MLRIASALIVTVLMTTCVISETFAKYVTSVSANDFARVAKFGVVIAGNGNAFAKEYATDDVAVVATIANSVVSSDDLLTPPGTAGILAQSTITGIPEVAVNVKREATLTLNDWTLADNTTYYCPITITVGEDDFYGMDYDTTAAFKAAVEVAIAGDSKNYAAGTDLSGIAADTLIVSWAWAFAGGEDQTDTNDTVLGNKTNAPTIGLAVVTSVTQII